MQKDSYIDSKETNMWFYKLLLLLALIASWIPHESNAFTSNSFHQETHAPIFIDFEEPEEQEEDEGEELAA